MGPPTGEIAKVNDRVGIEVKEPKNRRGSERGRAGSRSLIRSVPLVSLPKNHFFLVVLWFFFSRSHPIASRPHRTERVWAEWASRVSGESERIFSVNQWLRCSK